MPVDHHIGADMMMEILSRASLDTVAKCRLLSKECKSLTYESTFSQLHSRRTNTVRGFFVQVYKKEDNCPSSTPEFVALDNPDSKFSLDFLPVPVRILSSTNHGLVLAQSTSVSHRRIPQFYVCKPTTNKWQRIPNPKTRYFTRAIAMMVIRGGNIPHYKILRLSQPNEFRKFNRKLCHCYDLICEVFDSEIWSWKRLDDICIPREEIFSFKPATSVSGVFHWLTNKNSIFAFNMVEESWRMLSLPEPLNHPSLNLELLEYEGMLALVNVGSSPVDECMGMDLWVRELNGENIWKKRHVIKTKPLSGEERYVDPCAFHNADVAVMTVLYQVIFFNFRNGDFDVVRLENDIDPNGVFKFESDFEKISLTAKTSTRTKTRSLLPRVFNPVPSLIFLLLGFTLVCYLSRSL